MADKERITIIIHTVWINRYYVTGLASCLCSTLVNGALQLVLCTSILLSAIAERCTNNCPVIGKVHCLNTFLVHVLRTHSPEPRAKLGVGLQYIDQG